MDVNIITFCDSVHNYNGKLIIVGTLNTLASERFPTFLSNVSFVTTLTFTSAETGHHVSHLRFSKKDNPNLILIDVDMPIDVREPAIGDFAYVNLYGSLSGMPIAEPGTYVATLSVEGVQRQIELNVVQAADPAFEVVN